MADAKMAAATPQVFTIGWSLDSRACDDFWISEASTGEAVSGPYSLRGAYDALQKLQDEGKEVRRPERGHELAVRGKNEAFDRTLGVMFDGPGG
jgi:hypothetical protein